MFCSILSLQIGDIVEINNTLFIVTFINVLDRYFIYRPLNSDNLFYCYNTNEIKLFCRERSLF